MIGGIQHEMCWYYAEFAKKSSDYNCRLRVEEETSCVISENIDRKAFAITTSCLHYLDSYSNFMLQ